MNNQFAEALFTKDFEKESFNELISLKTRSAIIWSRLKTISAIICNLRFSSSTLRFKTPLKSDWMNVSLHNVSRVAWLVSSVNWPDSVSSINWLDSTVAWLQSTIF